MVEPLDEEPDVLYIGQTYSLEQTEQFADWLADLRDIAGRARIVKRLVRLANGQFGDARPVGEAPGHSRSAARGGGASVRLDQAVDEPGCVFNAWFEKGPCRVQPDRARLQSKASPQYRRVPRADGRGGGLKGPYLGVLVGKGRRFRREWHRWTGPFAKLAQEAHRCSPRAWLAVDIDIVAKNQSFPPIDIIGLFLCIN